VNYNHKETEKSFIILILILIIQHSKLSY